ncbi:MAG TPA: UDP-N-acetylmuramoyl-tripeptide--D-alanyl-D-alanine ligase [Vicinamibacteria bacterium]|nr:UDP-N-acetylmuramoyl-tripeptide--D-alanyl-D-alanine ligase [Vicinamibacteria bacterium]
MREALLATLPQTLEDVAAITGGRLVQGSPVAPYAGVSIDSRTLRKEELFFAIAGPRFDGHDFVDDAARRGAAAAVVHRDVPGAGLPLVRVADTATALQALGRETRRRAAIRVVAITGSVGKTTTKEMAAALLAKRGPVLKTEGNLNNRYGLPLTLLRLQARHAAAALELGMSAPGELRVLAGIAQPDVAVITRIAPVHLEFFASLEAIADAKAEILEGLRPDGTAVLNGDDPLQRARGARPGRVVWFGHDRRLDVSAENWRGSAAGMRFDLVIEGKKHDVALPLAGAHFVENFLAAAAAVWALGVPPETIAATAHDLAPARHRGELLRLGEDVVVVDDCYNSNPVAVEAALDALKLAGERRRVAILGDMLELGATGPALHRKAGERAAATARLVVGVGPLAAELVAGAAPHAETRHYADAAAAAAAVAELVQPGDAVLVKGSRGVGLESVVEALSARFGRERR